MAAGDQHWTPVDPFHRMVETLLRVAIGELINLNVRLDRIERKVNKIQAEEIIMAGELDTLTQKVEDSVTVQEGAVVLLGQLSDLIRAGAQDPAKILALADRLDAERQKVADALVANTPAANS